MEARDRLLRALQDAGLSSSAKPVAPAFQQALSAAPAGEPGIETFLPGFWQDTPAGRIFVVERRYELDYRHGDYPLGRALDVSPALLARVGRQPALAHIDHRRIVYLDTETTGLAGGTGTLAFLVGVGHFQDGGFRLRQYFLDSLEREEALLRALSDYLDPFDAVVSYNGKVFDVPLLETRFILSRMRNDVRALPHLDLLFAARRLYRDRFGSCRLGEIERQVLGLTRIEDVPGFEVPALYFRFVRFRRFRALMPVFSHNALDVLSLVTLLAHLGGLHGAPELSSVEDRLALARICQQDGQLMEAIDHLQAALARDLPPVQREEAERRLSLIFKRLGRWDEAAEVWYRMARRPESRSVLPLVELASFCERQKHDLPAAVIHAENALDLLRRHHLRLGASSAAEQEDGLERRLLRLRARLDRSEQTPVRRRRFPKVDDT